MHSDPTLLATLRSIITGAADVPEDALIEQLGSVAKGVPAAAPVTVQAMRRRGGPATTPVERTVAAGPSSRT